MKVFIELKMWITVTRIGVVLNTENPFYFFPNGMRTSRESIIACAIYVKTKKEVCQNEKPPLYIYFINNKSE